MLSNPNPTLPDEIDANAIKLLFLEEFHKNQNVYQICQKLGISRQLPYFEWQRDPVFKERYDEIRSVQVRDIEDNLLDTALYNKKAYVPQIFMLKSWMPEKYGDKYEINQNSTITLDYSDIAKRTLSRLDPKLEIGSAEIVSEVKGLSHNK